MHEVVNGIIGGIDNLDHEVPFLEALLAVFCIEYEAIAVELHV